MTSREIVLIKEQPHLPLSVFAEHRGALACDCYVAGVEQHGSPAAWGWSVAGGENIDHHAAVPAMAREISSANLALRWVAERGDGESGPIVLTHTDCDSILTAGIVAGRLEPLERYGAAAIAADHTGAEDPIADLLQAIQDRRDVEHSLAMLARLEAGEALPGEVQAALDDRRRKRALAADAVAGGAFTWAGDLAWAQFDHEMDGEFFPALLPEAALIVVGSPHPENRDRWAIKVRRGFAMPEGRTLQDLDIEGFDAAYGGRWNAGSTRRGGGSVVETGEWVEGVVEHLGSSSR